MNWAYLRHCSWLDTRSRFLATVPKQGALLDLGSSDGETLRHFAEMRPDLRLFSVDMAGAPESYPPHTQFFRANLETARLPWPEGSLDAITCMHLVEHLHDLTTVMGETARLLKVGGRVYFETPHPKTIGLASPRGKAAGTFTMNFYDDPTHLRPVAVGALAELARADGLQVVDSGVSRNWLFAAAYPFFLFGRPTRKKFTSRVHWLGWSAYLIAAKSSAPAR